MSQNWFKPEKIVTKGFVKYVKPDNTPIDFKQNTKYLVKWPNGEVTSEIVSVEIRTVPTHEWGLNSMITTAFVFINVNYKGVETLVDISEVFLSLNEL